MEEKSRSSEISPTSNDETPLVQRDEEDSKKPPNHLVTALLCFISLILGLVTAFPVSILVPESIDLGLTLGQAVIIISARPASSLLVLIIQPFMNKLNDQLYLILTGTVCFLGFSSFYVLVQYPDSYLYLAILARFISGMTLYLINNKTVVGITNHLRGDVTTSTTLWETFFFLGIAAGAAVGSLVDTAISFPLTMVVAGLILLIIVLLLVLVFPEPLQGIEEITPEPSLHEVICLNTTLDMIMYCWVPMICVGGGLNYAEGITTAFYRSEYSRTLRFGGFLQLEICVVYSITAAVIGILRDKWPIIKIVGICIGLFGAGIVLPFVGPIKFIHPPGALAIITSATALNCLMMFYCAIMLNSVTVSALALAKKISTESATSLAVNSVNVAYSFGSIVGPVIGGQLLLEYNYKTVWATGAPFYVVAALVVGVYAVRQYRKEELPLS